MHFFQIVIEENVLYKKSCSSQKWKVFVIIYYGISKIYSVHSYLFCSVNLSYFILFFILGFQSSIIYKLKNTLNCRLKLNDNNWSFLVAYSPSIK